jgi:DinB superfamily
VDVNAQRFFVEQHGIVAGVVDQLVLVGLDEAHLRQRPAAGQNSLAWLLWHAARWEDVMVNTWIFGQPQVFDRERWYDRLAAGTRRVGTAMTSEEVGELSDQVDLNALGEYRAAIAVATPAAVMALDDAALDQVIDDDRLADGEPDGAFHNEDAAWMDGFWSGHPVSWFLSFLNLHAAEHLLGEALAVRSQLSIPLGL